MAIFSAFSIFATCLALGFLVTMPIGGESIGVCYGRLGNDLPQPSDVVALYKSKNIGAMRIYDPYDAALQALKGSNIELILDVPSNDDNNELQRLASDSSAANDWVKNNIVSYWPDVKFKYIAVGNEVIPEKENLMQYVQPAMQNIYNALSSYGLQDQIKVSTSVSFRVVDSTSPPSHGVIASAAQPSMVPIIQFLSKIGAPLLVNVYPYFSYTENPDKISIDFALFTSPNFVVNDGSLNYQNLFDAMVDSLYYALEKSGGSNVGIVISESGWPSAGGDAASIENAQTYNQNLIKHVGQGTPKRPGAIETYIFAMFNENNKGPEEREKHFGLFYPDQSPVYPINF
ncbi:glucan endo-1,3-beta-glucosidase-like [Dioscorea cayenensis subsp. rotundata]|uniref:Glucan endo-1,3-beta-glucosidase-like n=1 Tax=Dioscorea cayennensis subsp. rotundata TaxID=55577 RepID=A0AB40BSA4_DIOCR|nr:glucan endo-1,3-beta-glucosidase-like [Dioscorea cayenensis subsp. rotundata]